MTYREIFTNLREEALSVAYSTERCVQSSAEAAIRRHYRACRLAEPKLFVWFDSPLAGAVAAAILVSARTTSGDIGALFKAQLLRRLQLHPQDVVRAAIWDRTDMQLRAASYEMVQGPLEKQIWEDFGEKIRDRMWVEADSSAIETVIQQVKITLVQSFGVPLAASVHKAIIKDPGRAIGRQIQNAVTGMHHLPWAAWVEAFSVLRVKVPEVGLTLANTCRQCGWWWPFSQIVILTDRPTIILRDSVQSLRYSYADGFTG